MKQNILEGTKWKELARQGKLSQKDFDTLKNNNMSKKYLDPRQIIKNKERGQTAEAKKLGIDKKIHVFNILNDPLAARTISIPFTNRSIILLGKKGKGNVTQLQRRVIAAHEKDEAIQGYKLKQKIKKTPNTKFKMSKKDIDYMNRQHQDLSGQERLDRDLRYITGYQHNPGVLDREFELRNLLYPTYRNSKNKHRQSFRKGKYTLAPNITRDAEEINYQKSIPKKDKTRIASMMANRRIRNIIAMLKFFYDRRNQYDE